MDKGQKNYNKDYNNKADMDIIEEKITKVNGDIHIKEYQKGKLLGKGGFAKCFEVTNLETKKILAAKIIPKAQLTKTRARQKLISEIKIHKSLHNTNVVQFEHVFEDQENVYILLELCTNQTLNELIKRRKRLHELECMCYVMQIIHALKYLHTNRVIHRDLKLGNLFLGEKIELKLGDFGLATKLEFEGEKKRTICGTPNYIAPEILDDKSGHSYPVDIWSLGVIIYTMLIGKPPFETPDVKTTYKKIRQNNYSFPEQCQISDQARDLIVSILQLDPSKRPTIDEVITHPFLNMCQIPKNLPFSTLAVPPSKNYIQQFYNTNSNKVPGSSQFTRLMETQPDNFHKTDNKKMVIDDKYGKQMSGGQMTLSQTGFRGSQNKGMQNTGQFQQLNTVQSVGGFQQQGQVVQRSQNQQGGDGEMGNPQHNEVWVVQWVDYSSKYGLGYLLSNGCSGVYFNDSTKIIIDNQEQFDYMYRVNNERQDSVHTYNMQNYPQDLKKKVTLLQHFRTYLETDNSRQNGNREDVNQNQQQNIERPLIYVKKWLKTKHAIMFRLSNKVVQVNFTDVTEILLSSQNRQVTFVNKKGERSYYPLSTALESKNTEMAKRLKYTKEILTHMLNKPREDGGDQQNQQQQQQQQQPVENQ